VLPQHHSNQSKGTQGECGSTNNNCHTLSKYHATLWLTHVVVVVLFTLGVLCESPPAMHTVRKGEWAQWIPRKRALRTLLCTSKRW